MPSSAEIRLPLLNIVSEPDIERLLKLDLYQLEEETLLNLQPLLSSPDISALEQAVAQHRQDRA